MLSYSRVGICCFFFLPTVFCYLHCVLCELWYLLKGWGTCVDSASIMNATCLLPSFQKIDSLSCDDLVKPICEQSSARAVGEIWPSAGKKCRERELLTVYNHVMMAVGFTLYHTCCMAWLFQICGNEVTHLFNQYTLFSFPLTCRNT